MPATQLSNLRPGEKHGVRSECAGCGEVFCGVAPFDKHRRDATAEELIEDRWMSRRCRTTTELTGGGFSGCQLDRWSAPSPPTYASQDARDANSGTRTRPGGRVTQKPTA